MHFNTESHPCLHDLKVPNCQISSKNSQNIYGFCTE
uniref:Uncharacterized protein n=1 Tax=Anguilla anguilla TaxID=7936 RepID=A0A0E9VC71_ANGAN